MAVSTAALHVCSAAAASASADCSFIPASASNMARCREDLHAPELEETARAVNIQGAGPLGMLGASICCTLVAEAAVERRSSECRGA